MYIMTYKKYARSKLATVVSFFGMLLRYGGILFLVEEKGFSPGPLLCIAAGIGAHFLAELIAKRKTVGAAKQISEPEKLKEEAVPESVCSFVPPKSAACENEKSFPDGTGSTEKRIFCVNCGAQLNTGMKFCNQCGTPVGAAPGAGL